MSSDEEITVLFDSRQRNSSVVRRKLSASFPFRPPVNKNEHGPNPVSNGFLKPESSFNDFYASKLMKEFSGGNYTAPQTVYKENIVHQMFSSVEDKKLCKIEIIPTNDPKVHLVLSTNLEQQDDGNPEVSQDIYQPLLLKRIKISTNKKSSPVITHQPPLSSEDYRAALRYKIDPPSSSTDSRIRYHSLPPQVTTNSASVSNIFQDLNTLSQMKCNKLYPIITVNTAISPDEMQRKHFYCNDKISNDANSRPTSLPNECISAESNSNLDNFDKAAQSMDPSTPYLSNSTDYMSPNFAPLMRKSRVTYTPLQLKVLLRRFARSQYLGQTERDELAEMIDLTESQAEDGKSAGTAGLFKTGTVPVKPENMVKIWFQNRRSKYKKLLRATSSCLFSHRVEKDRKPNQKMQVLSQHGKFHYNTSTVPSTSSNGNFSSCSATDFRKDGLKCRAGFRVNGQINDSSSGQVILPGSSIVVGKKDCSSRSANTPDLTQALESFPQFQQQCTEGSVSLKDNNEENRFTNKGLENNVHLNDSFGKNEFQNSYLPVSSSLEYIPVSSSSMIQNVHLNNNLNKNDYENGNLDANSFLDSIPTNSNNGIGSVYMNDNLGNLSKTEFINNNLVISSNLESLPTNNSMVKSVSMNTSWNQNEPMGSNSNTTPISSCLENRSSHNKNNLIINSKSLEEGDNEISTPKPFSSLQILRRVKLKGRLKLKNESVIPSLASVDSSTVNINHTKDSTITEENDDIVKSEPMFFKEENEEFNEDNESNPINEAFSKIMSERQLFADYPMMDFNELSSLTMF